MLLHGAHATVAHARLCVDSGELLQAVFLKCASSSTAPHQLDASWLPPRARWHASQVIPQGVGCRKGVASQNLEEEGRALIHSGASSPWCRLSLTSSTACGKRVISVRGVGSDGSRRHLRSRGRPLSAGASFGGEVVSAHTAAKDGTRTQQCLCSCPEICMCSLIHARRCAVPEANAGQNATDNCAPAGLVAGGRVLGVLLDHAQVGVQAHAHRRVEGYLREQSIDVRQFSTGSEREDKSCATMQGFGLVARAMQQCQAADRVPERQQGEEQRNLKGRGRDGSPGPCTAVKLSGWCVTGCWFVKARLEGGAHVLGADHGAQLLGVHHLLAL